VSRSLDFRSPLNNRLNISGPTQRSTVAVLARLGVVPRRDKGGKRYPLVVTPPTAVCSTDGRARVEALRREEIKFGGQTPGFSKVDE